VGHRAGLDGVEKRKFLTLLGLELRPARSQSLYPLRYLGSQQNVKLTLNLRDFGHVTLHLSNFNSLSYANLSRRFRNTAPFVSGSEH
jgi:hypothetical protein